MRKLLAATLLLPALVLAQIPSRAPPANRAQRTPARPAPQQAAPAPSRPSAEPPGAAGPGAAPGAPGAPGVAPAPGAGTMPPPAPTDADAGDAPTPARGGGTATISRGGACQPLQGRFLLAFNKADVVDVLEQASRWTCRNFAYTDDIARGKITLLSKTPVTADEAYNAFLAALTTNNIAVYQSGRYWKLVRIADAKKTPIPTLLDDGSEVPAQEQPVTKLLRLRYAEPDQLRGILGNFTSAQGADIQSIPPDVLIITDIGLNVRRLEKIIEAVDRPGSGDLVRFIQVRYASARDIAEKVNQIFQAGPAQPGRPQGRRQTIGGVATPGAPTPAPAVAGGAETGELSIQKVLADERTNKLVVIADEKGYERIRDLVAQLDQPTAGEGQIHVVFMKNANADELAQTLSALAQGQASTRRSGPGGAPPGMPQPQPVVAAAGAAAATSAALFAGEVKVTADKQSNALIVLASGPDFATMQRLIDNLDRPRRQVFVEAVIMEVNLRNENQFGVSAHTAIPFSTSDGKGFIPLGTETGRVNSFDVGSLINLGGFLTGLVGPVSAELRDVFPVSSLSVLVQALQTSSDVNVLSTPHVLASDNEESEITVGQNVPFQAGFQPGIGTALSGLQTTSGTSATTTALASAVGLGGLNSLYAPIQRQNVELRLRIKPQINEGDMVRLELDEQTEEIVSNDAQLGPTTAKRSVKTKIVAKDQHTIVIGGLIQERTVQSVRKVPLLGDIPVFGWLFRDQVTTRQKTNLLLFLTPYIIRDPSDYRRILERKRREQQEFTEQFYGRSPRYDVFVDYARKAGPYARIRKDIDAESMRLENGGPGAPGERTLGPADRSRPPSLEPSPPAPVAPRGTPKPPPVTPAPGTQPAPSPAPTPPPAIPPSPPPAPAPAPPPPPATEQPPAEAPTPAR